MILEENKFEIGDKRENSIFHICLQRSACNFLATGIPEINFFAGVNMVVRVVFELKKSVGDIHRWKKYPKVFLSVVSLEEFNIVLGFMCSRKIKLEDTKDFGNFWLQLGKLLFQLLLLDHKFGTISPHQSLNGLYHLWVFHCCHIICWRNWSRAILAFPFTLELVKLC